MTRSLVALALLLVSAGCTPGQETASSATGAPAGRAPDGTPLGRIALPDLSKMAASVQAQIRRQHADLQMKIGADILVAELGDAYGELGRLLMAAQSPEAAEACFVNAQTLDPGDVRWLYYLAHLYRTRGELARAAPLFARAIQLKPDEVAARFWLGEVYLAQGRPAEAELQFASALSLQPSSLSARFGLGRAALAQQDYRRAAKYFEEVLARDPEAAGAHYPLAQAYRALGDARKASEHMKQRREHDILPADPLMVALDELLESPQTHEKLGIQALDRKDWAGASAEFRKGLALDPTSAALRHRLGTALYMLRDVRGAREQFEQVVRESPDYARAHYSLGVLAAGSGRHAEAVERFATAIDRDPNYLDARVQLAASLRRTGRVAESLDHYAQILSTNPTAADARFGYAMALVELRRYREARDHLAAAITAYPDQRDFAHGLARLLAAAPDDRVRDGRRALALVEELLKQQKDLDLGETMAMALAEVGEYGQAAALQRSLIESANRAGLDDVARRLVATLRLYERGEPCRTPWPEGRVP